MRTIDHPAHPAIKANSDDCSRYIANGLLVEESLVGCWLVFSRRRDLAPDAHLASFLEDAVGNAFSIMEAEERKLMSTRHSTIMRSTWGAGGGVQVWKPKPLG